MTFLFSLPGRLRSKATVSALALWVLPCVAPLPAASVQSWELSDYRDFILGAFENVSLSLEGGLTLAPKLESMLDSDQPVIWSLASGPNGRVYAGTGHQGHVYEIDSQGETRLFWKSPEIEVFALAAGPDGFLYAGTSPKGKIYRIARNGEAEEFFDPGETYIWSLVFSKGEAPNSGNLWKGKNSLFAGTGEQGKIYRVDKDGAGEVYFETRQRHVVSLAADPQGRLLAGTDPNGILYRISGQGKAFALLDSDLPEIRALQVLPGGEIHAAAMGGGANLITQSVSAAAAAAQPTTTIQVTARAGGGPPGPANAGVSSSAAAPTPAVTAAQPVISYPGAEKAALLRLRPGVAVEKLWSSSEENLLALQLVGDKLFFATDRKGRVYRLDPGRRVSLVAETGHEQVTRLRHFDNRLWISTAHSGALYRLDADAAPAGEYRTAVRDTKKFSRWGRLSWDGDAPAGAAVEFRTRSGNSARPDETWSEWSEPITGRQGGAVTSPAARYIQWKATLRGGPGNAPAIRRVRLAYLPQNSPPVIRGVEVSRSAAAADSSTAAGAPAGSDSSAAFSITVTDTGGVTTNAATSTAATALGGGSRSTMTISWTAEDPDGDPLRAEVSFRGVDESTWKVLGKDLEKSEIPIDSEALADGVYRFRVKVSDRMANPAPLAYTSERISEPVLIDHTPPVIRTLGVDGRAAVRFEAADGASALQQAEYSIDAGSWTPLHSDDGIIDSLTESFTIRLSDLGDGEHLLTLRVRDRAGNAGLGKAVIR